MGQKRNSFVCLVLAVWAVAFVFSGLADAQEQKKVRIGVVSFENSSQGAAEAGDKTFGSGMADILVTELIENRNYEMVERTRLDSVLSELKMGATGIFDEATSREIGKIVGLDYIVIGNIIEASISVMSVGVGGFKAGSTVASVVVNVKVIEVETGKLVISEMAESKGTIGTVADTGNAGVGTASIGRVASTARIAIAKVAYQIKRRVAPVEYTVLQVRRQAKGGEVMIDIGLMDGARENQKYKIIREGNVLTNPRTGEIVGVDITEVADIIVTRADGNMSAAKIVAIYQEEIVNDKGKKQKVNRTIELGDFVRLIDRTN